MRILGTAPILLFLLLTAAPGARAHCDSIGGPVTSAALRALDTANVNLILPYVPASAEKELNDAFQHSLAVRGLNPEAKALSEQYFMETSVRLHRAGEGAPYTGLKPADTDFGPAIPAAEQALQNGRIEPLVELLSREMMHTLQERFAQARATQTASKEPSDASGVVAARKRVSAELGFIGDVEKIYLAILGGGGHAEGAAAGEEHAGISSAGAAC